MGDGVVGPVLGVPCGWTWHGSCRVAHGPYRPVVSCLLSTNSATHRSAPAVRVILELVASCNPSGMAQLKGTQHVAGSGSDPSSTVLALPRRAQRQEITSLRQALAETQDVMLKGKQTYNQVMHTKDLQIAQVGAPGLCACWARAGVCPSGATHRVCLFGCPLRRMLHASRDVPCCAAAHCSWLQAGAARFCCRRHCYNPASTRVQAFPYMHHCPAAPAVSSCPCSLHCTQLYELAASGVRERAKLRQEVNEVQTELQGTRRQLHSFMASLMQLKNSMASAGEGDLEHALELLQSSSYSASLNSESLCSCCCRLLPAGW